MVYKKDQEYVEELSFIVSDIVERTLANYSLKKEPENKSLEACLNAYTKEKLLKLADENVWDAKKSWPKANLVHFIKEALLTSFEERFLILEKERLSLLQDAAEGKFETKDVTAEEISFYLTTFEPAVRMGLIYTYDKNLDAAITFPAEVKDHLGEMLRDYDAIKKAYQPRIMLWEQFEEVLTASVHLYGVVTIKTVLDLWKDHFLETEWTPQTFQETFDEIVQIVPLLAIRNEYLIVDGYFIGSPRFVSDEHVLDFYAHRSLKWEDDYYQPQTEELQYYANHSFERRTPVYKRLKQIVARSTNRVDFVMDLIETNILMGESLSVLMNEIGASDLLQFQDEKQVRKFIDYYTELHNNSRIWENGGYTPTEVYEEERFHQTFTTTFKQIETADHKHVLPLATSQKKEKVGRNDPCPCGSGKKYKRCCMRKEQ